MNRGYQIVCYHFHRNLDEMKYVRLRALKRGDPMSAFNVNNVAQNELGKLEVVLRLDVFYSNYKIVKFN